MRRMISLIAKHLLRPILIPLHLPNPIRKDILHDIFNPAVAAALSAVGPGVAGREDGFACSAADSGCAGRDAHPCGLARRSHRAWAASWASCASS